MSVGSARWKGHCARSVDDDFARRRTLDRHGGVGVAADRRVECVDVVHADVLGPPARHVRDVVGERDPDAAPGRAGVADRVEAGHEPEVRTTHAGAQDLHAEHDHRIDVTQAFDCTDSRRVVGRGAEGLTHTDVLDTGGPALDVDAHLVDQHALVEGVGADLVVAHRVVEPIVTVLERHRRRERRPDGEPAGRRRRTRAAELGVREAVNLSRDARALPLDRAAIVARTAVVAGPGAQILRAVGRRHDGGERAGLRDVDAARPVPVEPADVASGAEATVLAALVLEDAAAGRVTDHRAYLPLEGGRRRNGSGVGRRVGAAVEAGDRTADHEHETENRTGEHHGAPQ